MEKTFEPILQDVFFDKILALSNKKSTFVLVSGFLTVVFSNVFQIVFERSLFNPLERHLKIP